MQLTEKIMTRIIYHRLLMEQLDASQEDDLALAYMTRRSEPHQMTDYDLRDLPDDHVLQQLQQVAILRAVYSKNQLLERMVDFWTNHFNLYARKGYTVDRIGPDQSAVIRKHALGNFGDLLSASAHSPAMLAPMPARVAVVAPAMRPMPTTFAIALSQTTSGSPTVAPASTVVTYASTSTL